MKPRARTPLPFAIDEVTDVDAEVQIVDEPPPRSRRATLPYGARSPAARVNVRVG